MADLSTVMTLKSSSTEPGPKYLFLFAGGLLATFIVVVVLYLIGVSQLLCLGIGVLGASLLVWQTFAMNRKYGEHGLMKGGTTLSSPLLSSSP